MHIRRPTRCSPPPPSACSSPGPYRVPKASFNYKTVFSNTAGLHAYRGPWQYETLTREILLDIAARKMGMDPVELRRAQHPARRRDAVLQPQRHAV